MSGMCVTPQRLDVYFFVWWVGYAVRAFHMQIYPFTIVDGTGLL